MHLTAFSPPQPLLPLRQQQVGFGLVASPKPKTWVATPPERHHYATHEWGHALCALPALDTPLSTTKLFVDSTFTAGKACAGTLLPLYANPTTVSQAKALLLYFAGGMAAEALADNPLATPLLLSDKHLENGQKDCLAMAKVMQDGRATGYFEAHHVTLPPTLENFDQCTRQELVDHCRSITQAPLVQEALATAHKLLNTLTPWQRNQMSQALVSQQTLDWYGITQTLHQTLSHDQHQTITRLINEFVR